ncbi:hypothetical protein D3C77_379370 [compost metagenome]
MPVQINITGENAAQAHQEFTDLHNLFVGGSATPTPIVTQSVVTEHPNTQQFAGQSTQAPVSQVPTSHYPQQVPTQQAPVQSYGQVPTAQVPNYDLTQLGVAAQPIMDAGRQADLIGWLQQHGAQALTQLDPKFYGDFATFLRSLGAKI